MERLWKIIVKPVSIDLDYNNRSPSQSSRYSCLQNRWREVREALAKDFFFFAGGKQVVNCRL